MNPTILVSDLVTAAIFVCSLFHFAVTQQFQADLTASITSLVGLAVSLISLWSHIKNGAPSPSSGSSAGGTGGTVAKLLLLGIFIAACLQATGCATAPAPSYIQADQQTYNAIAPEYQDYVNDDPALAPDEKQRRLDTLATWQLRINHAESSSAQTSAATQPTAVVAPAAN
jgi:hypothetical protein